MVNIKVEPQTPVASAVCAPAQRKTKRRVPESQAMPRPLHDVVAVKRESPQRSERHHEQNKGRVLDGQVAEGLADTAVRPAKKDRGGSAKPERLPARRETGAGHEDVAKMKVALKKYEATVCKLVQKLKAEQATYKKSIQDLHATNERLREEITSIRDTMFEITSQRDVEQGVVAKLKGDNSNLLTKNGQLEEDLAKMIQNIQHSDGVLEEMQQRVSERDNDMQSLTMEKKYLVQQLDDMRRLSRSISVTDTFSPPEGRKGSWAGSADGGCCKEGVMGWLFGRTSTSRMFICGFVLSVALGYVFQNLHPAQATNPAECDYDIEMFSKM